jgi:hypothetical protein
MLEQPQLKIPAPSRWRAWTVIHVAICLAFTTAWAGFPPPSSSLPPSTTSAPSTVTTMTASSTTVAPTTTTIPQCRGLDPALCGNGTCDSDFEYAGMMSNGCGDDCVCGPCGAPHDGILCWRNVPGTMCIEQMCVGRGQVCDGYQDCAGGEDEENCGFNCGMTSGCPEPLDDMSAMWCWPQSVGGTGRCYEHPMASYDYACQAGEAPGVPANCDSIDLRDYFPAGGQGTSGSFNVTQLLQRNGRPLKGGPRHESAGSITYLAYEKHKLSLRLEANPPPFGLAYLSVFEIDIEYLGDCKVKIWHRAGFAAGVPVINYGGYGVIKSFGPGSVLIHSGWGATSDGSLDPANPALILDISASGNQTTILQNKWRKVETVNGD